MGNHVEIVNDLNLIPGITVFDLSDVGKGIPDILVGYKKENFLVELKINKKATFTPAQKNFHGMAGASKPYKEWKGQKAVAYTLRQVLEIIEMDEKLIQQICDYDQYPF